MSRIIQTGLSVAIAGILGTAAAQAQDSAHSTTILEEIVVTAQKRVEKLQDVPIAITVVGEAQLAQQQIYNIADLARTAPSLEMIQLFGGPGGGGQIRGISTVSFAPTAEAAVGIVVDGVPQGRANSNNIFDTQRVEVLRGPQGTLFGLTTSAGVINMTTQAPKIGEFETLLHADYSNSGTAGSKFGRTTLRGVVNIPINDAQALRLAVSGDRTQDVQFNRFKNEESDLKDYSARVRYLFSPSEDFQMNLIADFGKTDSNYGTPDFNYVSANPALTAELAACGITPSYDNRERCGARAEEDHVKNYGASAQFDFGFGAGNTLTSITGYRKNEVGPTSQDFKGVSTNVPQIFQVGSTSVGRQVTQELRLLSPTGQRIEYVVGLFYSDYDSTTDNGGSTGGGFFVGTFTPGGYVSFIGPPEWTTSHITNKSYAAFGQGTFNATDKLALIAGARYTRQEIESTGSGNLLTPAPIPTFGEVSENNVSGKLGIQYKFNPGLTSYATATRGYKGPQVTAAAQGVPASILEAEEPTAYEVGMKGSLFGGALGFDANVFSTKVKNFQGQRCRLLTNGALSCPAESVPEITTKGFELGLYGSPFKGLSLNGGFIYDIAEYPKDWTGYNPNDLRDPIFTGPGAGQGTTSLSEAQLVNVPKTKFTFSSDYSHAIGGVFGFVSFDTVYKSEIRFGPTGDSRFVYPSHWTHGARLGVRSQSGAWSVSVFGRNLTDEHEPINLFAGPSITPPNPGLPTGAANGVSQNVTATSLRQVGLSVDVKF